MIRHHPSDTILLAAAASSLPAPHLRVLTVHLGQCAQCRATLRLAEEIGGALLEIEPPADLSPGARTRALARLDELAPREPPVPEATTLAGLATGRWRWLAPGIRVMPLARRDASGTRLDLIRVTPGTALPTHGHHGLETTVVLQGAFADETGEYRVGDFASGDGGLDHAPHALPGGDCICLLATSGRLRAHSLVVRLLQPFYGV